MHRRVPATALDRWLLAHRRLGMAVAAVLALTVALCLVVIEVNGSLPGDGHFIHWIEHAEPPTPLRLLAAAFAALASPVVACISVLVACVAVERLIGLRHALLLLAAAGAVALNAIIKTIVGPTPLQVLEGGRYASSNFPSGHVVYATAVFGTLAWFALTRARRGLFVAMLALVIGMGPFRIIDGAHWPSDVLAGYALGFAWTIIVLVLGTPWAIREETELPRERGERREPASATRVAPAWAQHVSND
ncbi:MAG TPA: phosphatase PAP2 family protein [Solirubrobacteraceae bacterium]|nr:phosphatase PAP2 family protein [Solirubrobacteraceae bacterium]